MSDILFNLGDRTLASKLASFAGMEIRAESSTLLMEFVRREMMNKLQRELSKEDMTLEDFFNPGKHDAFLKVLNRTYYIPKPFKSGRNIPSDFFFNPPGIKKTDALELISKAIDLHPDWFHGVEADEESLVGAAEILFVEALHKARRFGSDVSERPNFYFTSNYIKATFLEEHFSFSRGELGRRRNSTKKAYAVVHDFLELPDQERALYYKRAIERTFPRVRGRVLTLLEEVVHQSSYFKEGIRIISSNPAANIRHILIMQRLLPEELVESVFPDAWGDGLPFPDGYRETILNRLL